MAAGRATYGTPLLESNTNWSYANTAPGDLTARGTAEPTGRLTFADPTQAAKYAPDMYEWVQRQNAMLDTAEPRAIQSRKLLAGDELFKNDLGNQIYLKNLTPEQQAALGGSANLIGARQMGGQQNLNKEVGAVAIAPDVARRAIAQAALDDQQRQLAARLATAQATSNVPEQTVASDIAKMTAGIASDKVSTRGSNALLGEPSLIEDATKARTRASIVENMYPDWRAPEGMMRYINPATGEIQTLQVPGTVDPMAALMGGGSPTLDAIASDFPKKPTVQPTLQGIRQSISPVAAAAVTPVAPSAQPVTAPAPTSTGSYYSKLPIVQRIGAFMTHPEYPSGQYPGDAKAAADFEAWKNRWFRTPEEQFTDRLLRAQGLPGLTEQEKKQKKAAEEIYKQNVRQPLFFQP